MKRSRPLSHQVGPYTVRQDAGPSRTWRVFSRSVAIFHSEHLIEAFGFAQAKLEEQITTVACPACGARAGQRCYSLKGGKSLLFCHTRRQDVYNAVNREEA